MSFRKLRSPSLTDLFVSEIKSMILNGELSIGEKLPPERQLAEEMDVSPAVIHAGVAKLVSAGFLKVVPRQGTFVEDYIRNGNINTMMEILEFTGRSIDHSVFDPITVLRRSVESGAAKLACRNRTRDQLEYLAELIKKVSDTSESDRVPENAFNFYHGISMASGNMYYPMISMTFKSVYMIFFKFALTGEEEQRRIASQLECIYKAIEDRDSETAESAVNAAVDAWLERFEHSGKIKSSQV